MVGLLTTLHASLLILAAYFVGSTPFGLLVGRAVGIDVRDVGSGNIGATNVARTIGKKAGAVVLLFDALKGAVPAIAVQMLGIATQVDPLFVSAICFAAIFGHCFPIWLKFRGGKGVATAVGAYLVLDPAVAMLAVVIFIAMYAAFRVVSLGSITASVAAPVLLLVLDRPVEIVVLAVACAGLITLKHGPNIRRLLGKRELKV